MRRVLSTGMIAGLMAIAVAGSANARDLQSRRGIVLAEEDTPTLGRVVRANPDTHASPAPRPEPAPRREIVVAQAEDRDTEEPALRDEAGPLFRPLSEDEVDISDVEIFGEGSAPVFGTPMAAPMTTPQAETIPEVDPVQEPTARPAPRPAGVASAPDAPSYEGLSADSNSFFGGEDEGVLDIADAKLIDPLAEDTQNAAALGALDTTSDPIANREPERVESFEPPLDAFAEAEAYLQALNQDDIDISGVEIFGLDRPVTESAAPEGTPHASPRLSPQVADAAAVEPQPSPMLSPSVEAGNDIEVAMIDPAEDSLASVEIFDPDAEPQSAEERASEEAPVEYTNAVPYEQDPSLDPDFDPKAEDLEAQQRALGLLDDTGPSYNETYETASLHDPSARVPDVVDRSVDAGGDEVFSSEAFPGNYAGVGTARGMQLELSATGPGIRGWFIDTSGQVFSLDGELVDHQGHAQAAVVSDAVAIGYLDMQLTNLGLGALFVPLADDMSPIVSDARQYEFLRALSPEAQAALAAQRAARQEELVDEPEPRRVRRQSVFDEDDVFN